MNAKDTKNITFYNLIKYRTIWHHMEQIRGQL